MDRMRTYKIREKGTEKYISNITSWAFVPADKAYGWKSEKVALFDRLKANRKARRESKDICRLLLAFKNGDNVAKVYDELQNRSYKPRQDETLFQDEEKDA